jgi:hypothetical protein
MDADDVVQQIGFVVNGNFYQLDEKEFGSGGILV